MSPAGVCAEESYLDPRLEYLSLAHAQQTNRIPPEVAKAFVRDMIAFFAAGGTGVKTDGMLRCNCTRKTARGMKGVPITTDTACWHS